MNQQEVLTAVNGLSKRARARVFVDGAVTGATIVYGSDGIDIHGLEPELPPHLRLRGQKAWISDDSEVWTEVPEERELQMFWLFDPRRVIASDPKMKPTNKDFIEVHFRTSHLNLPPEVEEFLGSDRRAILRVKLGLLTEMEMPDWSRDSKSSIRVQFEYE